MNEKTVVSPSGGEFMDIDGLYMLLLGNDTEWSPGAVCNSFEGRMLPQPPE